MMLVHLKKGLLPARPCPNPDCCSNGLNLDLHNGFDYVWCKTCGVRGPYFDGHPEDAVKGWNSLPRKNGEDNA